MVDPIFSIIQLVLYFSLSLASLFPKIRFAELLSSFKELTFLALIFQMYFLIYQVDILMNKAVCISL